ncbi:MAG: NAD(P)-dependent alcohol dehydrogenase [Catenulispora sp.]|nr:NAD(P)-dependent alcohol dehydrogenase [Catenulispora sp.]
MKAVVQERFGPPETLRFTDVEQPGIGPDDVLLRVHAAALNHYDWHVLRGDPYIARLGRVGLTRPKTRVGGVDAAGCVEAVGANVRTLRPGDEVYGFCSGAFAEYARAKADLLAVKPAKLSFEEAAAIPTAATTALRAIREVGRVKPGDRVLVNGASGGVGTYAVQIAAALEAEVTAVCSTRNLELVRSLGAARVVDYTARDFTDEPARYDVILDNIANHPLSRVRRALAARGTLVLNAGGTPGQVFGEVGPMLRLTMAKSFTRQRLTILLPKEDRRELLAIGELIEAGKLRTVVGRTYPLADVAQGLRLVESGHVRGKIVVTAS